MPDIILYEFEPTRSLKCRWALLEAGLDYQSVGNSPELFGSVELTKVQPMGKLPGAIVNGRPLFESSAIVTAIADLAPGQNLIAAPDSWERNIHNQWMCFATSELEMWAWAGMLNTHDFLMPKEKHIAASVRQMAELFKRGARALDGVMTDKDFVMGDAFSATDIIVGYALNLGHRIGFLDSEFSNLHAYLDRLHSREHCTLSRPENT